MKISFVEETHTYLLNDKPVPSVTQILQKGGLVDLSGIPPEILERARRFGVATHKATELWDMAELDEDTLDPLLHGHLTQWKKFCIEHNTAWYSIEKILASEQLEFAGTCDRIGLVDDRLSILDIKTSSYSRKTMITTGIQLAGYNLAYDGNITLLCAVWLKDDGYKMVIYNDMDYYDLKFRAAIEIAEVNGAWKKPHRRKR